MRILLVEDYEPVRRAVAKGLTEAGFEVEIVADGQTGQLWRTPARLIS